MVELFIMAKINETIIYVNDDNYKIIYAFHPTKGFIYDYQKQKGQFDTSSYLNYKKIINLKFHYLTKNISPDKIEVMYTK